MQKFDYSKLRGRIVEKYTTCAAFAEAFGCSRSVLSAKLSGTSPWTIAEVRRACELLDIKPEEIHLYFFVPEFH